MKYKLTEETLEYKGHILHRIEALKDFGSVQKGNKGGFIESETNLSQDFNCWVGGNAKVFDNAKVLGNASIYENAEVFEDAMVCGDAEVFGDAEISGNSMVYDNAVVYGNVRVYGHTQVFGNAEVYDNAMIYGNAWVHGNAEVKGDAKIESICDYIVFKNWWSSSRHLTWTRSNNKWKVGCFYGTGEELVAKAYKDSELSGREYKRLVDYVESIIQK